MEDDGVEPWMTEALKGSVQRFETFLLMFVIKEFFER